MAFSAPLLHAQNADQEIQAVVTRWAISDGNLGWTSRKPSDL